MPSFIYFKKKIVRFICSFLIFIFKYVYNIVIIEYVYMYMKCVYKRMKLIQSLALYFIVFILLLFHYYFVPLILISPKYVSVFYLLLFAIKIGTFLFQFP